MTSKNFYSKLTRNELRRNIWALALAVLGFLCAGPLPLLGTLQNIREYQNDPNISSRQIGNLLENLASQLETTSPTRIGMIIMATLCGVALFRFWHNRQQVDFYGALPIRREGLYFVKFMTGLLLVLPAYILNWVISAAVVATSGTAVNWGRVVGTVAFDLFTFLLFYAAAILCTLLSGNTVFAIVLDGWLFLSPALLQAIPDFYGSNFYSTYCVDGTFWISPFLGLLVKADFPLTEDFCKVYLPLYIVMTVAALVLSVVMFRKRRGECAGQALALKQLRLPLKIYTCLVAGIGFAWVFVTIFGMINIIWLSLCIAIGVIVCHGAMEAIYDADVRSIFRNLPTMAILIVAAVAFNFGMEYDLFGYDAWTPRESGVKWVVANDYARIHPDRVKDYASVHNIYNYYNGSEEGRMRSEELIHAAVRLSELGTQNLALFDECNEPTYRLTLVYGSSTGLSKSRQYFIPVSDESTELLNTLLYSEEFLTAHSEIFLFANQLEQETEGHPVVYLNDILRGTHLYYPLRDEDRVQALTEALKADVLDFTPEQAATDSPVAMLSLSIVDGKENNYGRTYGVAIYSSYQRTLALLADYAEFTPEPLRAEDILKINLSSYTYDIMVNRRSAEEIDADPDYEYTDVEITDPAQISALLPYLYVSENRDRIGFGKLTTSIEVLLRDGYSVRMELAVDDVPEEFWVSLMPHTVTNAETPSAEVTSSAVYYQ